MSEANSKTAHSLNSRHKNSGKFLYFLLGLGFVISAVCMLYLVQSGVSLRTAPVISPSAIKPDLKEMADSLFVRLLPELRPHHYVVWGALPLNVETQKLFETLLELYEQIYKKSVQFVPDGSLVDNHFLESCENPCWILLPQGQADELSSNAWISDRPVLAEKSYQTISIIHFDRPDEKPEVSASCLEEKRLDRQCFIQISLRDVWKKMKSTQERYFFVRQYNQRDLFLFMQN